MIAYCLDCQQYVEAGDNFMVSMPVHGSNVLREICECVGNEHCKGDDYTEDQRLDDPRHGQADEINRKNRR